MGITAYQFVHHCCLDNSRTYGVYADAFCRVIDSGGFCQPENSVLAGYVGSLPRKADHASGRCGIDDGSASLLLHLENLVAHTIPHALQVYSHGTLELVIGNLCHRALRRLYSGIVECCIQTPVSGHNPVNHLFHRLRVGHVKTVSYRFVTFGNQSLRLCFRIVDVRQDGNIACTGKCLGTGETDTHSRTGHQSHFFFHCFCRCHNYLILSVMNSNYDAKVSERLYNGFVVWFKVLCWEVHK